MSAIAERMAAAGTGNAIELRGVSLPDYPHFFFCLYDLDLFDGDTVMYVLRTHPRVYVNGIIIGNPHYQADRLHG